MAAWCGGVLLKSYTKKGETGQCWGQGQPGQLARPCSPNKWTFTTKNPKWCISWAGSSHAIYGVAKGLLERSGNSWSTPQRHIAQCLLDEQEVIWLNLCGGS
jgi:hypothetical protein